ncbi:MAG: PQQ-binding-like beta-propeller repeat protein, partial [Phycisphaerales bacterium]|nr:PQQ-binding-like beta-propeller repeat protein [Phycisphaerales bacterium]
AVHPNGRALAVTHDDGRIRVRNAADGSLLRVLGPDTDSLYMGAAFHPQFPLIATIDFYGELLLYNVDDGRVVWRSDMGFGPGISVDFSPCGRFLAAGGYGWSGRMLILAPDGLPVEVRELDSPNKGVLKCVSFAGSNRLLVASGDGTLVVHERFSGRWSAVRSVRGLPKMELANGVAASPDARIAYVVARDQSLRAFSVESGEELACGLAHVRGVKSVHASPCGRYVATGSYDRTVMLWDSSNLTVRLPPVRLANSGVSSVRFGPEGVVFSCSFDGVTMAIEQETGRIRWMRTASDVSEGA